MKVKRVFVLAVVGFVFLFTFSVSAGGQKESSAAAASSGAKKTEVVWAEWWDHEWGLDVMHQLIGNFEKEHPDITVTRVANNWFDTYNKEIEMAQAGQPADVMGMEGIWMSALDKLGALEDIGPFLDKEGQAYKDRFVSPALVKYNGAIKAIYMYVYPFAIAYNPQLLQAAGLKPPSSLPEFAAQLPKLTDPKKNIYGTALPLNSQAAYHIMMIFGLALAQYGGHYVNADGTAAFNSPAGEKALSFMKSLVDNKVIVPGPMGATAQQTREYFASGKIVYTFDGPFITTITAQTNKELVPAYVPKMTTTTDSYIVGGSGLSLSAKSAHKQQAWEFIKYMMSDPVGDTMVKVTGLPWGLKSMANNPFVQKDPVLKETAAMINAKGTILFPVMANADKVQTAFAENVQAAVTGQKSIQAALSDAASEWDTLIKQ